MFSRFGKNKDNNDQDTNPYEYCEGSVMSNNDDTGSIYTSNTCDISTLRNSTNEMNHSDVVSESDDKFYSNNDDLNNNYLTPANTTTNDFFNDENNPYSSNHNSIPSSEEESQYSAPTFFCKFNSRWC